MKSGMKKIDEMTIEDIIMRKNEARSELARLSFGQKVRIVEEMRKRLAPFKAIRAQRQKAVTTP
jgi:putative heme iron utilization protein